MKKVPFISNEAIENRVAGCLIAAGMMPTLENPIVDLPHLIESHLKANLDEYCPSLPPEVMGEVIFQVDCKDQVNINRDLSDLADSGIHETALIARARLRSTTAHEVGHIILHREIIMPLADQMTFSLFDNDTETATGHAHRSLKINFGTLKTVTTHRPVMRTTGDSVTQDVDFMEIQANKAMAALLLPREIFCVAAIDPLRQWESKRGNCNDNDHQREGQRIIRGLADQFEVSRQVVQIRIKMLNLTALSSTPSML